MTPSHVLMERRRFRRHEKPVTADLYAVAGGILEENIALRDASLGGLSFVTVAPLHPGREFIFRLRIPNIGFISGKAVTRWASPFDAGPTCLCGAEIIDLPRSQRQVLRGYLEPSEQSRFRWSDAVLFAAGILVLGMLWFDLPVRYPQLWAWGQTRVQEFLLLLPLGLIVTGGLLGIIAAGALCLIVFGVYFGFTVFFRR